MRVRFTTSLGDVWRPGEVVDLPADTAKAFALAGYAVEVLEPMPDADAQDAAGDPARGEGGVEVGGRQ